MLKNKVRTYSVHQETPKMAIFILNRGRNAGKPLRQPCPNCFIIYCKDEKDLENYYWTFFTLWKNGFFHPHLCGSVIDMLTLSELKKLLQNWIQPSIEKNEQEPGLIERLIEIDKMERNFARQSKLLNELRATLVRKFYQVM